jgi:phytoene synthase
VQDKKENKKSSFFYAFALLPKEKREAMNIFYSFSRITDEIIDDENSSDEEKREKFECWRDDFYEALENKGENPLLISLARTIRRFKIPLIYFDELFEGFYGDLFFARPKNFEELEQYAYSVASTVGLIIIHILGFKNENARKYAVNLGKALQFTNIMRDVKSDCENGRIYLPSSLLEEFAIDCGSLSESNPPKHYAEMMKRFAERTERFYELAHRNFPEEDYATLYPARAMGRIYYELFLKIKKKNYDVFSGKISVGKFKRLRAVFGEILKGRLR